MVTAERRKKKRNYLRSYFNKHKNDSSKMWMGINYALESSKNQKKMPLTIKNVKNELMSDPQEIADNFAEYFESVPDTTRKKIKPPPCNDNKFLDHLHKTNPSMITLYNMKQIGTWQGNFSKLLKINLVQDLLQSQTDSLNY